MKNLINYLDFNNEDGIYECTKYNISGSIKDKMKNHKRNIIENK